MHSHDPFAVCSAAVAAKLVATVLRSHSQLQRPAPPRLNKQDDSTDTEDSDDSGSEEHDSKTVPDSQPTPPIESYPTQPTPPIESYPTQPTPPIESYPTQPTPPPRKKKLLKLNKQHLQHETDHGDTTPAVPHHLETRLNSASLSSLFVLPHSGCFSWGSNFRVFFFVVK